MTGDQLIRDYASELSTGLPPSIVEELHDGLAETYYNQLRESPDEVTAARAAITEFGDPDTVVRAFTKRSPARRLATALLFTGPLVGLAWATVLINSKAWSWPVPLPVRIVFGLSLLVAIGLLVATAVNRERFRRSRVTGGIAAITVVGLDCTLIVAALLVTQSPSLLLLVAATASVLRITLTTLRLPRLLAG